MSQVQCITYLTDLKWHGDDKMPTFLAQWDFVVEHLGEGLSEITLRDILKTSQTIHRCAERLALPSVDLLVPRAVRMHPRALPQGAEASSLAHLGHQDLRAQKVHLLKASMTSTARWAPISVIGIYLGEFWMSLWYIRLAIYQTS